jgi:hypothetical protein
VDEMPRAFSAKSSGLVDCASASSNVMSPSRQSAISDWSNVCMP